MGNWESGHQASKPPETPEYVKYSHLKELMDPRSPKEGRTPVLALADSFKIMDPRSPTTEISRTPIYKIPEPGENLRKTALLKACEGQEEDTPVAAISELEGSVCDEEIFDESTDSLIPQTQDDIGQAPGHASEVKSNDHKCEIETSTKITEVVKSDSRKESGALASDENVPSKSLDNCESVEKQDACCVQKNESLSTSKKSSLGNKHKTTKTKNKRKKSGFIIAKDKESQCQENLVNREVTAQKTFKAKQIYSCAVSRSPLAARNFDILEEEQSPSMQALLIKTQMLSISNKQLRARNISNELDLEAEIGKENWGATFSP